MVPSSLKLTERILQTQEQILERVEEEPKVWSALIVHIVQFTANRCYSSVVNTLTF